VDHGQPQRSVKSAKTCFLLSDSLDKPSAQNPGFDKPLGHVLEIVPVANPVVPMGPGQTMRVRVLFQGRPLAGVRVSFIPRGQTLAAGWDERFERSTDAAGEAAFTPTEGNYYLIVVHHMQPEERGTGYTQTKYSATLTMLVPHICLCCGE
jgi:uncharacterized GH25 family protein